MARATFTNFDAEVTRRIANRTDISAAERAIAIHDAYLLVANMFPHPALQGIATETATAAVESHTLAITDFWWPMLIRDTTNERPIDQSSKEKVEVMRKVSGPVTEYYWWANDLYWNRLPDASFTFKLWYKKRPDELGNSSSPVFDRIYDPLIPKYAAHLLLSGVSDFTAAAAQSNDARSYMREHNLQVPEAEKNDRIKGIQVRFK